MPDSETKPAMTQDPAAIAVLLNKTQKLIIMTAPVDGFWFPVWREGWHWPWRSLSRLTLVYPREIGFQTLSPLGLSVRQILEEQDRGE